MKNSTELIGLGFLLLSSFLTSCQKDQIDQKDPEPTISDYLPLKVGAKYLYSIDKGYSDNIVRMGYRKYGECLWEFTNMTLGTSNVYTVQETFNGIYVHAPWSSYPHSEPHDDTTIVKNEVSTLTFEEYEYGKVKITFPLMYFKSANIILKRFLDSSVTDTCFSKETCLSKDVGITLLYYECKCNHADHTKYKLLKGPY